MIENMRVDHEVENNEELFLKKSGDSIKLQGDAELLKLTIPLRVFCVFLFLGSISAIASAGNILRVIRRSGYAYGSSGVYIVIAVQIVYLFALWIYFTAIKSILSGSKNGLSWIIYALIMDAVFCSFLFFGSRDASALIVFSIKVLPWVLYFSLSKKIKRLYRSDLEIRNSISGFSGKSFYYLCCFVFTMGILSAIANIGSLLLRQA